MSRKAYSEQTKAIIAVVRNIPRGQWMSYGEVAGAAGSPGAARQVARILASLATLEDLPWHRVLGQGGRVRLAGGQGRLQSTLLRAEGVRCSAYSK